MVGLTSTPLPRDAGHRQHDLVDQRAGQLVVDEQFAAARRDVNRSWPNSRSMTSAPRPAALTTQRVVTSPAAVCSSRAVAAILDRSRHRFERSVDTAVDRVGGQRQVGGPGADDRLVGHGQAAEGALARGAGTCRYTSSASTISHAVVAVVARPWSAAPAARRVPRRSRRPAGRRCARPGCRSASAYSDSRSVAARDQPGFEGAGLGVEPGVQDRGVGLAGAVTDVVAGLEQRDRSARSRPAPGRWPSRRCRHRSPTTS